MITPMIIFNFMLRQYIMLASSLLPLLNWLALSFSF